MMAGGTYIGALLGWRMAHLHTLYLDRNGQKAGLTWDTRQLGLSLSLHAVPEFLLLHNTPPCALSSRETWWYRAPREQKQKLSDCLKVLNQHGNISAQLCQLNQVTGPACVHCGNTEVCTPREEAHWKLPLETSYQEGSLLLSYSSFSTGDKSSRWRCCTWLCL